MICIQRIKYKNKMKNGNKIIYIWNIKYNNIRIRKKIYKKYKEWNKKQNK